MLSLWYAANGKSWLTHRFVSNLQGIRVVSLVKKPEHC